MTSAHERAKERARQTSIAPMLMYVCVCCRALILLAQQFPFPWAASLSGVLARRLTHSLTRSRLALLRRRHAERQDKLPFRYGM